jgi:hypothetical protein
MKVSPPAASSWQTNPEQAADWCERTQMPQLRCQAATETGCQLGELEAIDTGIVRTEPIREADVRDLDYLNRCLSGWTGGDGGSWAYSKATSQRPVGCRRSYAAGR